MHHIPHCVWHNLKLLKRSKSRGLNYGICDHGFMAERPWWQNGLRVVLPHCTFTSSHPELALHRSGFCVCVFKLDQFPELEDKLISQLDGPAREGLRCMEEAMWRESWIVGNHDCLKTRRKVDPRIRLVIACDMQLMTEPMGASLPRSIVQGIDTQSSQMVGTRPSWCLPCRILPP